jgi:hypothetical protein
VVDLDPRRGRADRSDQDERVGEPISGCIGSHFFSFRRARTQAHAIRHDDRGLERSMASSWSPMVPAKQAETAIDGPETCKTGAACRVDTMSVRPEQRVQRARALRVAGHRDRFVFRLLLMVIFMADPLSLNRA